MSALSQFGQVNYPTPEEILGQLLSDYRYSYQRINISINVAQGTEPYVRLRALADRISIAIANNQLSADAISPLTKDNVKLLELAKLFGVFPRLATASTGFVQIGLAGAPQLGQTFTIPVGFIASAPDGNTYKTIKTENVEVVLVNGIRMPSPEFVELLSVRLGNDTEQLIDVSLTWNDSSITLLSQTCTVASGGIDGGADKDSVETVRLRLLRRLGFPAAGGNKSHVADLAEKASATVSKAFVFSAIRGPASYDVAVISDEVDRDVPDAELAKVESSILGELPGPMDLNVTSVVTEQVDLIVDLELPLPEHAGGTGGGWRDMLPYPSSAETGSNVFAEVTSIANLLTLGQITVNSTSTDTPVVGRRIGIWNPFGGEDLNGEMNEYTIKALSGSSGAYIITLDTLQVSAIGFITTGMYLSAGSYKIISYSETLRDLVALLGPGEKTSNVDILVRGKRYPPPEVERFHRLTTRLLSSLAQKFPEIQDISFAGRFSTGTKTTKTVPSVPAITKDPPRAFRLKHLSFRRKV